MKTKEAIELLLQKNVCLTLNDIMIYRRGNSETYRILHFNPENGNLLSTQEENFENAATAIGRWMEFHESLR